MRPHPAAATWGAVLPGAGRGEVSKEALPTGIWLLCRGGELVRSGTFQGSALLALTSLSVPTQAPSHVPCLSPTLAIWWTHELIRFPRHLWSHSASHTGALLLAADLQSSDVPSFIHPSPEIALSSFYLCPEDLLKCSPRPEPGLCARGASVSPA